MYDRDLVEAARAGARRAGYHLLRAGWEVLAGVGAFVEELRRAVGDDERADKDRPEHIPVED